MINQQFRKQVADALLKNKAKYPGTSDKQYAKMYGFGSSVYSRLKKGETEGLANDSVWIEAGRKLNVGIRKRELKLARTSVYEEFERNIMFCKKFKKSAIIVDEPGVGKTRCSKHILSQLDNAFYIDCSQGSQKTEFTRLLASTLGLDNTGRIRDLKENIKYYIQLTEPIIVLDDAGYLDFKVFVDLIEYWNATEKHASWIMLGDDSFQATLMRGLKSKKRGFRALFSRFSDECVHFVPQGGQERTEFMKQLIGDVASVNCNDPKAVNKFVKLCVAKGKTLRHLETLIDLHNNEASLNYA